MGCNEIVKKIVIMCSSFAVGGAENMVAQLICGLDKSKFDITVIVSNPRIDNHIQRMIDESNVKIVYGSNSDKKSIVNRVSTFFKINHALIKEKPEILHTNLNIAVYVIPFVLFHKVRYIHTVHNIPEKDSGRLMRKFFSLLVRLGKIHFSSISSVIQQEIVKTYHISKQYAPVIVNPVDCNKYNTHMDRNDNDVKFITVGRLAKQKNQALLIDAFSKIHAKFPKTSLSIFGDGTLKNELAEKIKHYHLEDSVLLMGNRSDLPALYGLHDVFILSSDYEGLPLTVLEAEAAGLPVISTDVGGVSDIVSDKNGILVEKGNAEALANAMEVMIIDKIKRVSLGVASKEEAQKYDISIFLKKYTELYMGDS